MRHFHFFGMGLALFTLAFNVYSAWFLCRRLKPRPFWRLFIWEAALLLSALYPAARAWAPPGGAFGSAFMWSGFFVLGASFIVFWWLAACDLLLSLAALLGFRNARSRAAGAFCAAAALVLVLLGLKGGAETPAVKKIEVPVKGLPARLDGFSILQISDLHLGRTVGLKRLRRIAEASEEFSPDMIAMTGDFAERRERMPDGTCGELLRMKASAGKFGVLGNHDMFTGGAPAAAFFEKCGFRMLRGSAEEPVPGLVVAGVDDLRRGDRGAAAKLAAALDRKKPLVFLSHHPQGFDEITSAGSGVVLAGHTHRGQIFPFGPVEAGMFKYFYGLYKAGDFRVYVTSGAGHWGPPLRLFAPSELPLLILRRADGGRTGKQEKR